MRLLALAAVMSMLAACGGGSDADEFATGNTQLTEAQIDAALGPADQSAAEDALVEEKLGNRAEVTGNAEAVQSNSDAGGGEDER